MKGKGPSKERLKSLEEQQQIVEKIGARIKELRIKKGHTSADVFAYENDINRTQYGRYERGEDMYVSSLIKVIAALGVTIDEFFGKGFD